MILKLKRHDSIVDSTNPRYPCSPHCARATAGRSPVLPGARIVGFLLAVVITAGCTTAPSWRTAQECEWQEQTFPNLCANVPAWQIAQDFKTLSNSTVPVSGPFADPAGLPSLNPREPRPEYRIGPLDELTITVWGAKEIWSEITDQSQQPTRVTTVQEDGTIVLPLLAGIQVNGLTVSETLKKIANSYREVLGTSFQVDAQVTKYRSKPVLLDGAVSKPGTVYLSNEVRTLGEAIVSGGGGLPETAEPLKGVLIRGDQRYLIDYQSAQAGANNLINIELQPRDRIYFPSRETGLFYVLGEVSIPGAFTIPPKGISLVQSLALAKGPSMASADMHSIYLVRINEKEPKIYYFTLGEIIASKEIPIVPGDRIFVPPTNLANFERNLRSLVPFLTSVVVVHGGLGVSLSQ